MTFLLAILLLQDAELKAARAKDRERIAKKPALTQAERSTCIPAARLETEAVETQKALAVDVIRVSFPDAAFDGEPKRVLDEVAEYYKAQSGGVLRVDAEVREPVAARVKRDEFGGWPIGGERETSALASFYAGAGGSRDAAIFVLGGGLGARETALWPHAGSFTISDRRVSYVVVADRARGFEIGVLAHELMHLFGLPDKYEDPDRSAGDWCLLGTGYRGREGDRDHTPLDLCADCKGRLGWMAVRRLDPRGESKVVLAAGEAVRVPLNRDASESLLLEMRKGKGLLVWHVEEKKTTEFLGVFPAPRADRLTPWSEPAFRGRAVGAHPVYLTDIRHEDGKVWLRVGPSAELTPLEELRRSRMGKRLGDR